MYHPKSLLITTNKKSLYALFHRLIGWEVKILEEFRKENTITGVVGKKGEYSLKLPKT